MRLRTVAPSGLGFCLAAVLSAGVGFSGCGDDPNEGAGKACASDDDCQRLVCIADVDETPDDLAPLALVCGEPRDGRAPHEACERGEQCALGVCLLAGGCARPCETDTQCEAGERCAPVYARTGTAALQTLHACVHLVDLPSDADVKTEIRQHALSGAQDVVTLPGIEAPTLLVLEHLSDATWPLPHEGSSCRPPLCAAKLVTRDEQAEVLFDREASNVAEEGPKNPVATGNHLHPVNVLLPNGPRGVLSESGYALTLESGEPGDLRITTLRRDQPGHRLDLNLFYVGARGLAAKDDRGPAFVADALEEVDRILGQADIYLGEVRQIDVTGKLLDEGGDLPDVAVAKGLSTIKLQYGVCPQLPELWKLSAGAANVALDVFFVADIEMCAQGDIGGISGGTPGPLGMHGTSGSGIAISTNMMLDAGDPERLGRTLAHELGHVLGLFHTTELDGRVLDPLPDTAPCPPSRTPDDACAQNLMFPTTEVTSTALTEQQREVLRSAIVLQ